MKSRYAALILIFIPLSLFAADFSLVLNVDAGFGGKKNNDPEFDFRADIWPRFTTPLGSAGEFTVMAGFTFGTGEDGFYFVPELLRTEFLFRFGKSGIRFGRIDYGDPVSFVTQGLFDGVQFFTSGGFGSFNAGIWYTGFLYKKNANIAMTIEEKQHIDIPLDYSGFSGFVNTYFAPKRFIAAVGWEHPSLGGIARLGATITGQIDLSGGHHSQYLVIKAGIPISNFSMEFGGVMELSQSGVFNMAFAGQAGVFWLPPGKFNSSLSAVFNYASGGTGGFITQYNPVTAKHFGSVVSLNFSGLSVLTLNYTARFARSLGVSFSASYFICSDLSGNAITSSPQGHFLGPEIFGHIVWSPFSDLQFNIGAGAFFPVLGNAGRTEPISWKAEISVTFSLL